MRDKKEICGVCDGERGLCQIYNLKVDLSEKDRTGSLFQWEDFIVCSYCIEELRDKIDKHLKYIRK
jgi:hypothetical protein